MLNQIKEDELYHSSRYATEFEEISFIAKGGFGAVFRAKNKLDGREYAVKKIMLKYCDPDLFSKLLREVTTLAGLSHPNVVSYKTAWLEPFFPNSPNDASRNQSSFPTLSYSDEASEDQTNEDEEEDDGDVSSADEALFSMDQNIPSESITNPTSSSIVFQSSEVSSSSIVFQEESASSAGDGLTYSPRKIVKKLRATSKKKSFSAATLKANGDSSSEAYFIDQQSQMARNVLSIQELGELDSFEAENVPTVQGMAATPPNNVQRPIPFTPSPNIMMDGMRKVRPDLPPADEVDNESPGSKFWVGGDRSDSESETPDGAKECPQNGIKINQTKE